MTDPDGRADPDGRLATYAELADILDRLPDIVRDTRRARHLSRRVAADQIGCSLQTVARIETGESCGAYVFTAIIRWLDQPPPTDPESAVAGQRNPRSQPGPEPLDTTIRRLLDDPALVARVAQLLSAPQTTPPPPTPAGSGDGPSAAATAAARHASIDGQEGQ